MSGYIGPSISSTPGAGGTEVFRWNRADTTQFEGAAVFADGSGAGSLSVITTAWGAPALRFTSSAGTSACLSWYAVDPLPFVGVRRDFIVAIETASFAPGAGGYVGMLLGEGTGAGYHALQHYCAAAAAAEWASRVTAGTRVNSGTTGSGISSNGFLAYYNWYGSKTVGSKPLISSYMSGYSTLAGYTGDTRRSGQTADIGGATDFGNGTAYAASWDALTLTRWGLTLQSSGGNALPTNWDILDLRIYLLPGS